MSHMNRTALRKWSIAGASISSLRLPQAKIVIFRLERGLLLLVDITSYALIAVAALHPSFSSIYDILDSFYIRQRCPTLIFVNRQ